MKITSILKPDGRSITVFSRWRHLCKRCLVLLVPAMSALLAQAQSPTHLVITAVNAGADPVQQVPFTLVLEARDDQDNPRDVATDTEIQINLASGSGTLSGPAQATMLAGTHQLSMTGMWYDIPDNHVVLEAVVISGDLLAGAQSIPFNVTGVASQLEFTQVLVSGISGAQIGTVSVHAVRQDLTTDPSFTGNITISIWSGTGTLSGTLTKPAVAGVADFSDLSFSQAGNYTLLASTPGLSSDVSSGIIITLPPTLTEVVVPRFMGSRTTASQNDARTPFTFCIQINHLIPNTVYDLKAGLALTVENSSAYGGGETWNGSGFATGIVPNAFTTDASGNSGPVWFFIRPGSDASRFGAGDLHHLRLGYTIHGGAMPASPVFTGSKIVQSLDIASTPLTSATTDDGAFLKGSLSPCLSGKYILIFDNVSGTGDPLFAYQARQSPVSNGSQSELPGLINDVYTQSGSSSAGDYPAIIPVGTNNPAGVRRIEARNADNSIFNAATDADGIWPGGANTTTAGRRSVSVLTLSDASLNPIAVTTGSVPALCFGASTGSISAGAVSLYSPVAYSWNTIPVRITPAVSNLPAGNYTVTVTDAAGCTITASSVVNQPPTLLVSAVVTTPVLCNGGQATVTVSASGGTPAYTGTGVFNGVLSGTRNFIVTDQHGCGSSTSVSVSQPNPLIASASVQPVSCLSGNDGSITVNATGGTTPYQYSLNASPYQPIPVFNTLASGSYTLSIKDANNCLAAANATVTQPLTGIVSTVFTTDVLCHGAGTGSISVQAVGGTPGYSFSLNGTNYQPSNSFNSLVAGPYTIYIKDSRNCLATKSTVLNQPSTLVSVTATPGAAILCNGQSTTVNVSAAGGTPPYSGTGSFNVTGGVHTFQVTDQNNCLGSTPLNIPQPAPLSISLPSSDVSCFGNQDGTALASASGGTGPYTYAWDLNNRTGLIFDVTVQPKDISHPYFGQGDDDGYVIDGIQGAELTLVRGFTYIFNVNGPDHSFHLTTSDVGGDFRDEITQGVTNSRVDIGSLTFTPDASHPSLIYYQCGLHPYMGYKINIVDGWPDPAVMNLDAGTYQLIVTDANNCVGSASLTITQPDPLSSAISTANACQGSANGTATALVTGGAGNYSYTWDVHNPSGSTIQVTDGIKNNTHPYFGTGSVRGYILDGVQGKELTLVRGIVYTFDVNSPGHPFILTTSAAGGSYSGEITQGVYNSRAETGPMYFAPDASHPATLYYQSGTDLNMGYRIHIVDPNNNPAVSGLSPGMVELIVSDSHGCSSFASAEVFTTIVSPTASDNSPLCAGTTLNLSAGGGVSYRWTGPNGYVSIQQHPVIPGVTAVQGGTYTVTVTEAGGCSASATTSVIVHVVAATASGNSPLCEGNTLTLFSSGGSVYAWSGPNGFVSSDQNPVLASAADVNSGTYLVTVTDNNGCVATASASVTVQNCALVLQLHVIIEGYYDAGSGLMRTTLSDLAQYGIGDEKNAMPSDPDATDNIFVDLYLPASATAGSTTPDYTTEVVLHNNGTALATFPGATRGPYYIAVRHRTSIETWSHAPVDFSSGSAAYDFTGTLSAAYDDGTTFGQPYTNPPMRLLANGLYGIYSGDCNRDFTMDILDMGEAYNDGLTGFFGYNDDCSFAIAPAYVGSSYCDGLSSDCNGDGTGDILDMGIIYNNAHDLPGFYYARPGQ